MGEQLDRAAAKLAELGIEGDSLAEWVHAVYCGLNLTGPLASDGYEVLAKYAKDVDDTPWGAWWLFHVELREIGSTLSVSEVLRLTIEAAKGASQ